MKTSEKTKITTIRVIIIGGTSLFLFYYQQPITRLSRALTSQIMQNAYGQVYSKSIVAKNTSGIMGSNFANQRMMKSRSDELSNAQTNEPIKTIDKLSTESVSQEEMLVQKYDKIINSLEYIANREVEGGVFASESGYYTLRSQKLKLEKMQLENKLMKASKENQNQIQNKLEDTKSKYREARVNMFQNLMLTIDAYDRVTLRHFTIDELIEIFKQKGYQISYGSQLPGVSKDDAEFVLEAKRRLKEKGFIPNAWTSILLSW